MAWVRQRVIEHGLLDLRRHTVGVRSLGPVPADLARSAPGLNRLQYQIVGNQLILVEPIYRQVLAVIAP